MPLPQAAASLPVKTTLGQSAAEMLPAVQRKKPPVPLIAAGGGLVVVGLVVAVLASRGSHEAPKAPVAAPAAPAPPPPAPRTFRVIVAVTPAQAQLVLDGLPAGQGSLDRELTADGREHKLEATAPGFEARTVTFVDAPPAPTLVLAATAAAPEAPRRKAGPGKTRGPKPAHPGPSVGANQAPILKE
jgi:hypothetical protein